MKRCVIIGGGNSIQEGIDKGLWDKLKNEVTFGCNEAFKFFSPTAITFVDWTFYKCRYKHIHNYPLVIGKHNPAIGFWYRGKGGTKYQKCSEGATLEMIQGSGKYFGKDSLKKGVYSGVLCGLFTTTLAIALGYDEIYLLGFDFGQKNGKTHFYQNMNDVGQFIDENNQERTGVGYNIRGGFNTGVFNNTDEYIQQFWTPYLEETDVKIYNVSMNSRIKTFDKITYDSFFERINDGQRIEQDKIRKEIRIEIQEQRDSNI